MEHIIAAFIIACSQLSSENYNTTIKAKSQCIQRITSCLNSKGFSKEYLAEKCSKEMYL